MNEPNTLKDSVACGAVLATMFLTIACGAFVVAAPDDGSPRYAQAQPQAVETRHE